MRPRLALPLGLCCLLAAGSPRPAASDDPPPAPPRAAPAAVRAVQVPMRDGALLAANVLLPEAPAWALARRLTYHPEQIAVPCLFVSGWWDHYPREVIETFEDVLARGGGRSRAGSALVLGPWAHTAVDLGPQGDLAFPAAEGYSTALTLRFFDRHLRGLTQAWEGVPRVHLFQTGEERWRTGARVADLLGSPTVFALRADGTLSREALPPAPGARPARTCRYDPHSPPPTIGGRNLPPLTDGPKDVASLATRPDVLVWQTAPLAQPLALCGEAEAAFQLAADRPDVDLSLRLCDAFPDGRLLLVGETIQRASLRDPRSVQPLKPGEPVSLTLRLPPHAYTWAAGHRLTLLVTSGGAPRYERNPHTGAPRWDPDAALDVTVTLFAGPGDATLSLPLSPR